MLISLERRVPPDMAPNLFRRIAERYLRIHQTEIAAVHPSYGEQLAEEAVRTVAYFRHTLENLDAIAVGE